MQILVTELTISTWGSKFISRYSCKSYYAHNQGLLLDDRTRDLLAQIDELTMPRNDVPPPTALWTVAVIFFF